MTSCSASALKHNERVLRSLFKAEPQAPVCGECPRASCPAVLSARTPVDKLRPHGHTLS